MFFKYPKLENFDKKLQEIYLRSWPDPKYIVTEKLDGCNVAMVYDFWRYEWSFYSRNGMDARETFGDDFFVALTKVKPALDMLARAETSSAIAQISPELFERVYLAVYGELVNSKVLNRITYYDETPQIRLFDMRLIGQAHAKEHHIEAYEPAGLGGLSQIVHDLWSRLVAEELLRGGSPIRSLWEPEIRGYLVPIFNEFTDDGHVVPVSIKESADKFDIPELLGSLELKEVESRTSVSGVSEGYVFHEVEQEKSEFPYSRSFKFKADKFRECRKRKPQKPVTDIITQGRMVFKEYITENRAYTVQSKMGEFTKANIGQALRELIEDAKEDFLREHKEFYGQDLKKICNVGNVGYLVVSKIIAQNEERRA